MKDGRGLHMVKRKLETREKVRLFIKQHPDMLKKDVCAELNISPVTLRAHIKSISGT